MKFISLSTKLNITVIAVSLVSIFIGFMVLFNYLQNIKTDVYTQTQNSLIENANEKIAAKMRIGITNAISIANDARIKTALKTGQREDAIDSLKDISTTMKAYTNFHNIKIHLHTKENISFLRNWKVDKYGDDLSSFRDSVVAVNKTHKPLTTFEAGRAGLLLRAIIPVTDSDNTYLGSLEFIQGINSVVKSFDKQKVEFLLLMKQKVQSSITKGDDFAFNKNKKFQDYIISQKYLNKDFLADAQYLDMKQLFQNNYLVNKNYFYTFIKVKDFQDKDLGIVLLAKPLSIVNSAISGAKNLIYMALLGIFGMMIVIAIVLMGTIKKLVTNPLLIFEKSLDDFFLFLQGKKDYTNPIKIDTNDEFGEMAKSLEENIVVSAKLHKEINQLNTNLEAKVLDKTQKVTTLLDNAGQGFLSFSCNLIIDEEYSKECIKLLGDGLAGKDISDILFLQNETKKSFFQKTILEMCRMDTFLVQKSILSLLPHEIILNKRALKLNYKILENKKFMLIITNITEQKKLEDRVDDKTRKLEDSLDTLKQAQGQLIESEKMAALGSLVSGVAHEVNTPLGNAVTGGSIINKEIKIVLESMQNGSLKKSSLENSLEHINETSRLLLKSLMIASDLIKTFKKISVDQRIEQKREFDIVEYLSEIVKTFHNKLKQVPVNVKITAPETLVLNSYPGDFAQLINNFIQNSIVHGFEFKIEDPLISIDVKQEDKYLYLIYKDNGAGMQKEISEKAFDPFVTSKRNAGGTGLGLSIVYNIVTEKLGGSIELETAPNQGVSYTIKVPL